MSVEVKRLSILVSAMLCGLTASQSWAADTVCSLVTSSNATTVTSGTSLPDANLVTTVIVASNFYAPAIEVVQSFLNSSATYASKKIGVCHNATGHIMSEITGGGTINGTTYSSHPTSTGEWLSSNINYKYGLFLAANSKAPQDLVYSDTYNSTNYTIGSAALYANGIPTLYLDPNEKSVGGYDAYDMVKSAGASPTYYAEGYYYGDVTKPTGKVVLNYTSYLSPIAIGHPTSAPYGAAAKVVLEAMNQWQTSTSMGTSISGTCTSTASGSIPAICHYDNIDLTLEAIDDTTNNIKAGFVSAAQLYSAYGANISNAEFVTFPGFSIEQWGVLLETDATNGTSNSSETAALALWNFMDVATPDDATNDFYDETGSTWNEWLVAHGYGEI
jgi:ABC-type molybdate transport system substrate-binding protein